MHIPGKGFIRREYKKLPARRWLTPPTTLSDGTFPGAPDEELSAGKDLCHAGQAGLDACNDIKKERPLVP